MLHIFVKTVKLQRDETEGEEKSEEKPATLMSSSTSSVPRKRKWGTSAKPNKSTTIDISTDSLKVKKSLFLLLTFNR